MKSNKNKNHENRTIVADLSRPEIHVSAFGLHSPPHNEGRIWLGDSPIHAPTHSKTEGNMDPSADARMRLLGRAGFTIF
ncbi:hypothetical protein JTH53_27160 [Pseudomonas capeferrum]